MKKILLACAAGMSTSIIVSKMKKYAKSIGDEVEIEAMPAQTALECLSQGWNVVLIGPQVKYLENNFKQDIEKNNININVAVIPFQDYGMANGESIYKLALSLIK